MEARRTSRAERPWLWLSRVWIAAVVALSIWQTATYTGIAAFLAEWQYDKIGATYPALTCLLMILVLSLPLFVIARLRRGGRKEQADTVNAQSQDALMAAERLRNGFGVAALITLCAIAIIGILTLLLPSGSGPVRILSVADALATPPALGATELRGKVLYDKVAVLNEDALFIHTRNRFAPIVASTGSQGTFKYFVEIPGDLPAGPAHKYVYKGVLRHAGLPGDIEKMYKYAGFKIDDDYYVLFASTQSMQHEYVTALVELGVLLVFLLSIRIMFHRRVKKLAKTQQDLA